MGPEDPSLQRCRTLCVCARALCVRAPELQQGFASDNCLLEIGTNHTQRIVCPEALAVHGNPERAHHADTEPNPRAFVWGVWDCGMHRRVFRGGVRACICPTCCVPVDLKVWKSVCLPALQYEAGVEAEAERKGPLDRSLRMRYTLQKDGMRASEGHHLRRPRGSEQAQLSIWSDLV